MWFNYLLVIETSYTIGGVLLKPLQKVPPIFQNQCLALSKSCIIYINNKL